MENIKLSIDTIEKFIAKEQIESLHERAMDANKALHEKTGKGNDFLGWVDLPESVSAVQQKQINDLAQSLAKQIDTLVVVGIGGSYLGAKAIYEALKHQFSHFLPDSVAVELLFAGQNIGEDYLFELLQALESRKFGICVISKSGTTTEPALAFRILKYQLEQQVGREKAKDLIVAITDKEKGALRVLAQQEGYKTFEIADDIGGRYSVLTPVGLFPLAVAGVDITALLKGASEMHRLTKPEVTAADNPAINYAIVRNLLYNRGYTNEILVNYQPKLVFVSEWWKQLFGESEGKEHKGIFPASVNFTTDLHSMGQYIQEGKRNLFETVISVAKTNHNLTIPADDENLDNLNYLAGKNVDFVNKMAELGTRIAHEDGGVPNLKINLPQVNEYYLGQLLYFFEIACGISGYLLNVNPFDQPGVEAYKKNMFALLEKPGFEELTKALKKRI